MQGTENLLAALERQFKALQIPQGEQEMRNALGFIYARQLNGNSPKQLADIPNMLHREVLPFERPMSARWLDLASKMNGMLDGLILASQESDVELCAILRYAQAILCGELLLMRRAWEGYKTEE